MKDRTTKQLQRLEKKKAKIAAFLEIAKLNDKDKAAKLQAVKQTVATTDEFSNLNDNNIAENNSRKRTCEKNLDNVCLEACKEENIPDGPELQENTKKPRLSDSEEYANLKEELRKRKKRLQAIPRLTLKAVGENAVLDVKNLKNRIPIFLSDIQHLLLYSLLGHHSPYLPARWCKLEKYNKISHTVVIVLEGLSSYHFMAYESMFPHIVHNLKHRLEVITPAVYGAPITEELAAVPLTGTQSDKLIKQYGSLETALQTNGNVIKLLRSIFPMHSVKNDVQFSKNIDENLPPTDKFCRTKLLLSLWQMVEENYPVPLKGTLAERYGSYILTKDVYEEATSTSPMFGLDCEMCLTTSGNLELTRISIVDEDMNVIYDSLVKPENAITNYLTRYSGITEDMLDDVTVTLHDVQQTLRTLLPPNAILVGQSLNSDLHTLKMMHPYIIDTSVIFNLTGERYKKTKLQILAREFLGESIQDNKDGHCSTEDSKASLKLVKLKLANSVNYGDAVLLGDRSMRILKMETTKRTLQKTEIKKYATSIFSHITKNKGTTAAIVGNDEVISEYSKYLTNSSLNVMDDKSFAKDDQVRLVIADSNEHAVDRTSEIAMEHAFVLCHVKLKEEQLKDEQLEKTFRTVNKWIHKVWQYSAINSLACVIFSGQNNTANGSCFLNIKTEISSDIIV
ncbi:PREDICTED: putative RNA exonuclease NEF-sp [Cyphomyrmex costatus]|uniref:Putative RNA exonuclease NEF-sp n=1 Tax=Cyphomyrmex costatus TaxID=456900 RepID=A0A195CLX5_9HYME|nr:PREDICTED: putative RNA exonuclease NEF-sp [Cyphomyrmex costatus]KYN01074.1 Putative RNA exonuclease NEF-sp [Cyphomyrmex costatus]